MKDQIIEKAYKISNGAYKLYYKDIFGNDDIIRIPYENYKNQNLNTIMDSLKPGIPRKVVDYINNYTSYTIIDDFHAAKQDNNKIKIGKIIAKIVNRQTYNMLNAD